MEGAFRRSLSTFLNPIPHRCVSQRYIIALSCAVLAVILRWLLDPILGHVAFYVTIHIVVAYCAIVCGYAPAIATALVGFLGIVYWFVDPRHSLAAFRQSEIHGVVGFFLLTIVLIALGEAVRSKQLRLNHTVDALTHEVAEKQHAQQELSAAHDELERRVEARTHELSEALARLEAEMVSREHTEEQLRHLSLRIMTVQDEERRHIARELHDTCGQTLAAMKMSIALVRQLDKTRPELQALVDDLNALADDALQEVRTTSYLLHPPLLDEAGIASAARWFLEGFASRSGIDVQVDIPQRMERPDRNCELVLFRVLQESLTNVHRHSGASAASVRLQRDGDFLELEIKPIRESKTETRCDDSYESSISDRPHALWRILRLQRHQPSEEWPTNGALCQSERRPCCENLGCSIGDSTDYRWSKSLARCKTQAGRSCHHRISRRRFSNHARLLAQRRSQRAPAEHEELHE